MQVSKFFAQRIEIKAQSCPEEIEGDSKEIEKAHTSQSAIARLESGRYENLSLSFLKKIGEALGAVPEVHFRKSKAA